MGSRLLRLGVLGIVVAGIALVITFRDRFDVAALESWVQGAGAAAPAVFMLIYALGAVFFLPGSVLTLAGGGCGPIRSRA